MSNPPPGEPLMPIPEGIPPPEQPIDFHSSDASDSSSPKYRKIALNGRPLSDEKPQHSDEADTEKEETYIDALGLGLRHSTTDVYVPLGGSELVLMMRRNIKSETASGRHGMRIDEKLENVFGVCWSSSIPYAKEEFVYKYVVDPPDLPPDDPTRQLHSGADFEDNKNYLDPPDFPPGDLPGEPPGHFELDHVSLTMIDENGSAHNFVTPWVQSTDGVEVNFIPAPTGLTEQDAFLTEVTDTSSLPGALKQLELTRKFGNKIKYEITTSRYEFPSDRTVSSENPKSRIITFYYRATELSDRYGKTKIKYQFNGGGIVPDAIVAVQANGLQDQKILIEQKASFGAVSMITAITDPMGRRYDYEYDGSQLKTVKGPVLEDGSRAITHYTYNQQSEKDYGFEIGQDPDEFDPIDHIDLESIQDPRGNTYTFHYDFDVFHFSYDSKKGFYRGNGLPRWVKQVDLPGGLSSKFQNHSYITASASGVTDNNAYGHRAIYAIDAQGNSTFYEFGDNIEVLLKYNDPQQQTTDQHVFHWPWMIYYKSLTISHFKGHDVKFDEGQDHLDPVFSDASLIAKEKYTFDSDANFAVESSTDTYGNVTRFEHKDPLDVDAFILAITGNYGGFATYNSEPTTQTNAKGKQRKFTYDHTWRVMTSMTDELGRQTITDVDSLGRRTSEKVLDENGKLIEETDFLYESTDFPAFMTRKTVKKLSGDPSWVTDLVTVYVPDLYGRLQDEIHDPDGLKLKTHYEYDLSNNKTSVTDPKGFITVFHYDPQNRLKQVDYPNTEAGPASKFFTYDLRGNKTYETDENSHSTIFKYDELNRLTFQVRDMNENGEVDAGDLITQFGYNNVNSKTSVIDPRGNLTKMDYDALQRLVQTTAPAPFKYVTRFEYGTNSGSSAFDVSSYKPTKVTDVSRNLYTKTDYDELYRPIVKTVQIDKDHFSITKTEYDDVGNVRFVTDPVGNVTETQYDALNRPKKTIFADTKFQQQFYTSTGLKFKVIDELGRETETHYDAVARATRVYAPPVDDGTGVIKRPLTKTFYDENGNVRRTDNPLNRSWIFEYDARNRKIREVHPSVFNFNQGKIQSPVLKWSYDKTGNVLTQTDARGNVTTNFYDHANRLVEVHQPSPDGKVAGPVTKTFYDNSGNVHEVVDANTHSTINEYDELNRLKSTLDAENILVSYEYDSANNRTKVTDGNGHETSFRYDGLNRNTKVIDAKGNFTTFVYDPLNKTDRIDAQGRKTHYSYDIRNRLKNVSYIGRAQDNRTYSYDDVGNLLSVVEPGKGGKADVAYTYDNLNRTSTETSGGITHKYIYDLAGNRLQTVYNTNGSSRTIISTYDNLNRLDTMTEGGRVTSYKYDRNDNVRQKQTEAGPTIISKTVTTYDNLNRSKIIEDVAGDGSLISRYTNTYDPVGNVLNVVEEYSGKVQNRTVTNVYDKINRLSTETVTSAAGVQVTTYGYDFANNRTSMVKSGLVNESTSYVYSNPVNQLDSFTDSKHTVSFTYDNDGNRKTRTENGQTDTYEYDFENRLINLSKTSGLEPKAYSYQYDYRTRRIERIEGTEKTKIVFSGGLSCEEFSVNPSDPGSQTLQVEYIRGSDYGGGIGGILYTLRSGLPKFDHYNRRGDITSQTDGSGAVTYQATYEAFGTRTQEFGSTKDRQKANSKEEDPTGLLNEGMRYRDLETGSFITRDPAGFIDGPNLYTYVNENPWTKWDPEGLSEWQTGPNTYEEGLSGWWHQVEYNASSFVKDSASTLGAMAKSTAYTLMFPEQSAVNNAIAIDRVAKDPLGAMARADDAVKKMSMGEFMTTVGVLGMGGPKAMESGAPELGLVKSSSTITKGEIAAEVNADAKAAAADVTPSTSATEPIRVNPQEVKYTQDSISPNFSNGQSVAGTTEQLKNGSLSPNDIKPINVVEHEGQLKSLDNRRLKAMKDAGVTDAPAMKKDLNDPKVLAEFNRKNKTKTAGESIKIRQKKEQTTKKPEATEDQALDTNN